MRTKTSFIKSFFVVVVMILSVTACKTTKNLQKGTSSENLPRTKSVLKEMKKHGFTYDALEVKKINIDIERPSKKLSLKASMASKNGEFIDLTLTKFLPIAKAHLDQEDVTVISYLERGYYQGEYSLLDMGVEVNYDLVQSILTGSFYNVKASSYMLGQTDNDYVLTSRKENSNRLKRTLYVGKDNYKVKRLVLEDVVANMRATVDYQDFIDVDGQSMPTNISVSAEDASSSILKAKLKLSKISLSDDIESKFELNDKYKKLN